MDRKHTKTIIIIMAAIIFALLVAVGILLVNAAKILMPAECPPSVRWDGQVYVYGEKLNDEHAAAEVLGNITAVVDLSRIPQNDGEANWPVIGAEVGRIGDETAIYVYSAWYRLEPENKGRFHNSSVVKRGA